MVQDQWLRHRASECCMIRLAARMRLVARLQYMYRCVLCARVRVYGRTISHDVTRHRHDMSQPRDSDLKCGLDRGLQALVLSAFLQGVSFSSASSSSTHLRGALSHSGCRFVTHL
jgi:hypothetical protein